MDQKALWKLTYGVYLLTARQEGRDNGCIINTAVQVASDPARISVAVVKGGCTHDMVQATGVFNVSALTVEVPFALFQRFGMQSGRDADKVADFDGTARSENGLLYLTEHAAGYLSCRVTGSVDLGSHTLFIGEVTDGAALSDREMCSYAYYQTEIKPKAAPGKKKAWVCSVCGYVYEGDEVPEDFLCPLCRHGKGDFVPVEAQEASARWICEVCGYVHEGDVPPENCPVCHVPASRFRREAGNLA